MPQGIEVGKRSKRSGAGFRTASGLCFPYPNHFEPNHRVNERYTTEISTYGNRTWESKGSRPQS
jgi:hypothetical protein